VRCNDQEWEQLARNARMAGMSMSDFVRSRAVGPRVDPTPEHEVDSARVRDSAATTAWAHGPFMQDISYQLEGMPTPKPISTKKASS
jgi:hypothetical protein